MPCPSSFGGWRIGRRVVRRRHVYFAVAFRGLLAEIEFHDLELDTVIRHALSIAGLGIAYLLVRIDVIGRFAGFNLDFLDLTVFTGFGNFALIFGFADLDAWRFAFFQLLKLGRRVGGLRGLLRIGQMRHQYRRQQQAEQPPNLNLFHCDQHMT